MGARIRIHPLLCDLAHNQEIVGVEGRNVGECLADLEKKFPGMSEHIFDRAGKLQSQIEILINGGRVFQNELTAPVHDGDELSILMLLAGG